MDSQFKLTYFLELLTLVAFALWGLKKFAEMEGFHLLRTVLLTSALYFVVFYLFVLGCSSLLDTGGCVFSFDGVEPFNHTDI